MEFKYQNVTPGQGWLAECNQDFRRGAKELNSLHPVSSNLPSFSFNDGALDEWMENETLGYNGLEAFNDVLLPVEQDFAPTDLFKDLTGDFVQEDNNIDLNASGDFNILDSKPSFTSYESLICNQYGSETREPKVTIKLKKIKLPKKNTRIINEYPKSTPIINEYPTYDYEVLANTPPRTESSPTYDTEFILPGPSQEDAIFTFDTDVDIADCSKDLFHTLDIDELMKEEFDLEQSPNEEFDLEPSLENTFVIDPNSSNVLTLKDALNMDNADSILENYLSPDRSNPQESPQPSTDQWASSPLASQEELHSPASVTSTRYSYSEGAPSPSNSINYSMESVLPTFYSVEGVLDLPTTPRTKQRKSKKREKMSPESRYLRKKEQNKQAALRYRAKKKQEDDEMLTILKEEEETNSTLEKEINRLQQEVNFMKKLMRETLIAKKLVPPDAFD